MNRNSKIIVLLTLLTVTVFFIKSSRDIEDNSIKPPEQVNYLSVEYENISANTAKFRYKYILSYTPANETTNQELEKDDPVFSLHNESSKLLDIFPTENYNNVIPTVSEVFSVSKNQAINDVFLIKIGTSVKNKDLIKFETKIILEQLKDNKWTPVYQVILMERGPYFSLDKGPIEFIKPN